WHEVPELAELAHRLRDAGAQPVDVRAALGGRDQVYVALADGGFRIRRPAQRVVDRIVVALARAGDGFGRDALVLAELLDQIGAQVARIEPLVPLPVRLVLEG